MATFATTSSDGTHEFVIPTTAMDGLQRSEYAILGAKNLVTAADSPTPTDAIKDAGFLASSLIWDGSTSMGTGVSGALPDLTDYKGVCNYGILFGDYHAI